MAKTLRAGRGVDWTFVPHWTTEASPAGFHWTHGFQKCFRHQIETVLASITDHSSSPKVKEVCARMHLCILTVAPWKKPGKRTEQAQVAPRGFWEQREDTRPPPQPPDTTERATCRHPAAPPGMHRASMDGRQVCSKALLQVLTDQGLCPVDSVYLKQSDTDLTQ